MAKRSPDQSDWESKRAIKICKVCDGTATCFNFNVIACESCKSFFRRMGNMKVDDLTCAFDQKCDITYETRKFCKRCRLAKCFNVGMKLPSVEKKQPKKEKESTKVIINHLESVSPDLSVPSIETSTIRINLPSSNSTTPNDYENFRFPDCLMTLTDDERHQIYELWEASSLVPFTKEDAESFCSMAAENGVNISLHGSLDPRQAAFLLEECHKRLIEWCKHLSFFVHLSETDQINLIKGSLPEMYLIYQLQGFDRDNACFYCSPWSPELDWTLSIEELKSLNGYTHDIMMRFILTYDPDWQKDRTLTMILMAITLYTPRLLPLDQLTDINQEYTKYKSLLRNYLYTQQHSSAKADCITEALLVKLTEIRSIQCTPQQYILKSARQMILPLLFELFGGDSSNTMSFENSA